MFDPICNRPSLWPFCKGVAVLSTVVAAAIAAASLSVPEPDEALRPPLQLLPIALHFRPAPIRRALKSAAPARKASGIENSQIAAGARSAEWTREVEQGRHVSYPVIALNSLPVLRSFAVVLAFDTRFPRGSSYLLDLGTGTLRTGPVPENCIVRELDGITAPDIEAARQRVEGELGRSVRVFALYPPDLYLALRGYADEALRKSGVARTTVEAVNVRLHLTGPRQFTVALEK